ncbi:hypothetical protein [Vandammella animalimorsus]|uniref:hypothetical protein n=1 Tax=Vandammella animalimorsus TaxID=2029117 RepID=UPI0015579423|nr:hypothetical protein [Vandammella animalimorsus]
MKTRAVVLTFRVIIAGRADAHAADRCGPAHAPPMGHTPSKAALFFNLKQRNTQ